MGGLAFPAIWVSVGQSARGGYGNDLERPLLAIFFCDRDVETGRYHMAIELEERFIIAGLARHIVKSPPLSNMA